MEGEARPWIELTESKQFSRLLYTNPVCFLSTVSQTDEKRNVMVISWLTATSNEGTFMFSMNRRRHSASTLLRGITKFVLSVPVKGMESLLRDVGSISGAFGSKFPSDHEEQELPRELQGEEISKRKAKRKRKRVMSMIGISGLEAEPLRCHAPMQNGDSNDTPARQTQLFAIRGTVAHLKCTIYKLIENAIDDDHLLILARVTAASVHPSYWNSDNSTFRQENNDVPPYLTFFGSQEFGYVVSQASDKSESKI
jgi:flavin reductase (DIM6/NTAB) family NADH-FMN oxidoreductase RutF